MDGKYLPSNFLVVGSLSPPSKISIALIENIILTNADFCYILYTLIFYKSPEV